MIPFSKLYNAHWTRSMTGLPTYLDEKGLFCSVVALIYFDTNSRRGLGPEWRQSLGFRC